MGDWISGTNPFLNLSLMPAYTKMPQVLDYFSFFSDNTEFIKSDTSFHRYNLDSLSLKTVLPPIFTYNNPWYSFDMSIPSPNLTFPFLSNPYYSIFLNLNTNFNKYSYLFNNTFKIQSQTQPLASFLNNTQNNLLTPVSQLDQSQSLRSSSSQESDNVTKKSDVQIRYDTSFERRTVSTSELSENLVQSALFFKGKVNNKKQGNKLFSGGNSRGRAYCADFVTYNIKKIYGNRVPSNIGCAYDPISKSNVGPSAVLGWQLWAQNNRCYFDTTDKKDKNDYVAKHVRRGDLMVEKRGGKSHIGIVTNVYQDSNGVTHFETIEGNVGSAHKVDTRTYTADSRTLSGFISLSKYST